MSSYLKGLMINTLRESTEIESVWQLRKAFLDKNLSVNADVAYRDHILSLSQCFVKLILQQPHDYPIYMVQEANQRSLGLYNEISKAQTEYQYQIYNQDQSNTSSLNQSSGNLDTNALSVIPTKKETPNAELAHAKFLKKRLSKGVLISNTQQKKIRKQLRAMGQTIDPFDLDIGNRKAAPTNGAFSSNAWYNVRSQAHNDSDILLGLTDTQHSKPAISTFAAAPTKHILANPSGQGSSVMERSIQGVPYASTDCFGKTSKAVTSTTANLSDKISPGKCTSTDPIESTSESTKEDDDGLLHVAKLAPVIEMANYFSEALSKDSVDPYTALQQCAAKVKQKVKCNSKVSLNKEGKKEISCDISISDIYITTVLLLGGTNPDAARNSLAKAAMSKICLPYLRLGSNSEDGLKLEGSGTPFIDDANKERDPVSNDATRSVVNACGKSTQRMQKTANVKESCHGLKVEKAQRQQQDNLNKKRTNSVSKPNSVLRTAIDREYYYKTFDSYIAWRIETNPVLKKIRHLGHLNTTLPCDIKKANIVLEFLFKACNIGLEVISTQHFTKGISQSYDFIIDSEILLYSCMAKSEKEAIILGSSGILTKLSMPYLCLKHKVVQTSLEPFPILPIEVSESQNIVLDNWQTGNHNAINKKLNYPVRFQNFYLTDGRELNPLVVLKKSTDFHDMQLIMKHHKETISVIYLNGHVIGKGKGKKDVSEKTLKNMRRSHWMVFNQHLEKNSKVVFFKDLKPYLPNTSRHYSDKDYDMEMLSNTMTQAAMGRKKCDWNPEDVLRAYALAPSHKPVLVRCKHMSHRYRIINLAQKLNMTCSIRGKVANRRVLVTKNFEKSTLFSDILAQGGMSDKFMLVPPLQYDSDDEDSDNQDNENANNDNANNTSVAECWPAFGNENETSKTKQIQCCLIKAPPLTCLPPGRGVTIIHEDNSEFSDVEGLSEGDYDDLQYDDDMEKGVDEFEGADHCRVMPSKKRKINTY